VILSEGGCRGGAGEHNRNLQHNARRQGSRNPRSFESSIWRKSSAVSSADFRLSSTTIALLAGRPTLGAESSLPPRVEEEIWGLPFPLPVLAYVVRPVGEPI
jgi:hypothetical protein